MLHFLFSVVAALQRLLQTPSVSVAPQPPVYSPVTVNVTFHPQLRINLQETIQSFRVTNEEMRENIQSQELQECNSLCQVTLEMD